MEQRLVTGRTGEDAAADEYLRRGFHLLARNWRCRIGELDLVVARGGLVVICEVKTRRGGPFGSGYEAVDARKQRKLRSVAEAFLLQAPADTVRFDVASVRLRADGSPSVEIFEDAF